MSTQLVLAILTVGPNPLSMEVGEGMRRLEVTRSSPNARLSSQGLLAMLLLTDLRFATIMAIVTTSLQQSLITEPISRLLEMLLYGA
jgi:hypothetical protein